MSISILKGGHIVTVVDDAVITPPPPPPPPSGEVIVVNSAVRFQTMRGWEATAIAWETPKNPKGYDVTFAANSVSVMQFLANQIGINRLQIPLRSGAMNTVDYWTPLMNAGIGDVAYDAWAVNRYAKIAGAPLQFAEFDFRCDTMLGPMLTAMQARGEKLQVGIVFTDFGSATPSTFWFSTNAAAYASFIVAHANRIRTRFGVNLDFLNITLEPENTGTINQWNGTRIGNALVAVRAALDAAGHMNVQLIAPDVTNGANCLPHLTAIEGVPGALAALTTASYHRYGSAFINYTSIANWAASKNKDTAMSEWTGGSIDQVIQDLVEGQVTAWQKWGVAGIGIGDVVYIKADKTVNPPILTYSPHGIYCALLFPYVREGAVRINSINATMKTIAFENTNGKQVVLVRAPASTSVTITGLRPGIYGVKHVLISGATTIDTKPDVMVGTNGQAVLNLATGYTTIYAR